MNQKLKKTRKPKDKYTSDGQRIVSIFRSQQIFIERLVSGQINWAREMKICRELYKKYPAKFLHFYSLPFDIPSVAYLIGEGKKDLDIAYKIWQNGKQMKPTMEDFGPICQDIQLNKRSSNPKNLFNL